MPTSSPDLIARTEHTTKDLEQFREFMRSGSPGPHAYAVLLGLKRFDLRSLLKDVKRGLPYRAVERLSLNLALPDELMPTFVWIPRRTLNRRKQTGRLLPDESDRVLRASRLFGRALELFDGSRDAAVEWLMQPQPAFGGTTAFELAGTELGAREVERLIDRLEHGVYS
ncbi:MAG TPA: antitoxin Xre/MbcA/ParS toxin-binding domain-containing protein [Thermoanaerobaculia bacterium]